MSNWTTGAMRSCYARRRPKSGRSTHTIKGHPDNAVAAVLGGVTVGFLEGKAVHAIRVADQPPLGVVIFVPDRPLLTAEARASLPREVPLGDAVFNVGRAAYLSAAFA